jgi:hypothetical protein
VRDALERDRRAAGVQADVVTPLARTIVSNSSVPYAADAWGTTSALGVEAHSSPAYIPIAGFCPNCGHSQSDGLEAFLGRLGITDEMVNNLKGQFQNVDIDEYLSAARTYLKDGSDKATTFTKENPGKVAAGVAALALGAGLIYAATKRDRDNE